MEKLEEMQWSVVRKEDASETEGKCLPNYGQISSVVWCRDMGNDERTRSTTRIEMRVLRRKIKFDKKKPEMVGPYVRRMKEENIVGRMLDVDMTRGKK